MKKILIILKRNGKGQALPLVLCFLALGALVITPLLDYVYTGLNTGQIFWEKVPLSYAAEAGLEDGIWKTDKEDMEEEPYNLEPYDYTTVYNYSLPEYINDKEVSIDIKQVWPLAGLEDDTYGTVSANDTVVTGGVINADGGFQVRLAYDTPEIELLVRRVGVWLPPDFEYVYGSSDGITTHDDVPDNPEETPWNGGTVLEWDFSSPINFDDLPEPGAGEPVGGLEPGAERPSLRILEFEVTPHGEIAMGSYSWAGTTDISRYLSWERNIAIYRIESTATDNVTGGSVTAAGYTYVSKGVDTGWIDTGGSLFTGNYRAIGNSLMLNLYSDPDNIRDTLITDDEGSSATISNIPSDAGVAFAYLYWSGWYNNETTDGDTTCTFMIDQAETINPNAAGDYTECEPYGDYPNYLCVDDLVVDDDSTYVHTGDEFSTLRPDAAGTYTQCTPIGASNNYQCVDEASADDDSTFVQTGGVEVLRPNGNGYYTQCDHSPYYYNNYQCVDDVTPDGNSSYIYTRGGATERDTYNIQNHSQGSGTINSITVHVLSRADSSSSMAVETMIRTHDNNYYGDYTVLPAYGDWQDVSKTYTTNPHTSSTWTWTEVDDLQAGVRHYDLGNGYPRTTQVYIEVGYGQPTAEEMDTYSIDDHTLSGNPINSVTVYIISKGTSSPNTHAAETVIRTNGNDYFGTYTLLPTSYTELSTVYTKNPYTSSAWTWDEIDALEAGVKHYDNGVGGVRTTQVYVEVDYGPSEQMDTYNLEDHSLGTGTINSITVYVISKGTNAENTHAAETVIRTHGNDYFGDYTLLPTSYTELSTTYTTNPYTSSAWTWDEIDALQAGVKHYDNGSGGIRTTQVYIYVNYGADYEGEVTADTWWTVDNVWGHSYSCFKDVTGIVDSVCPGCNAIYSVAHVDGHEDNYISYAGWSLIIIYASPSEEGHHFFLWNVLLHAPGNCEGTFVIEGFLAPLDAEAAITCFTCEGDGIYTGDYLQFNDVNLHDSVNPEDNIWNCMSSGLAGELIDGVDIDTFDVSSPIIGEGDTSAEINFITTTDAWNLIYLFLSFRSDVAVLIPSGTGIYSYGF
jgi:hypothetical protein